MSYVSIKIVAALAFAALPGLAVAQNGSRVTTTAKPSIVAPLQLINPPLVRSAPLRVVPLPPDTLSRPALGPVGSTYSIPYGPNFSRPSGSPVVPFGSSRYYVRPPGRVR